MNTLKFEVVKEDKNYVYVRRYPANGAFYSVKKSGLTRVRKVKK